MERQPININEARMSKLVQRRMQLRDELARVDTEIGKLDIVIGRSAVKDEPTDLDRDSMYRPQKFVDPSTEGYIETIHNMNRGKDRQGDPLFTKPPYEHLIQ